MNKNKGSQFEKKVQKAINSGALWFDKGDLKTDDLMIECKYTNKKSYRITTATLQKLWNDALEANKMPRLVIGIDDGEANWLLNVEITRGGLR